MADKIKIIGPDDKPYEGLYIPVRESHEVWNEYILEDGTVLRMKLVVTEVYRIEGLYDNDGNPVYQVKSSNVVAIRPPDSLKRSS
jgi:hypothetical protein